MEALSPTLISAQGRFSNILTIRQPHQNKNPRLGHYALNLNFVFCNKLNNFVQGHLYYIFVHATEWPISIAILCAAFP